MFSRNNSDYKHILKHIKANRKSIFLGFEKEPDIFQLSRKISENAERFEYWDKNLLIGLFACYLNDKSTRTGFITVASVINGFRNHGLGCELLKKTLEFAFDNGFKSVKLEVNAQNQKGIEFYKKFGFVIEKQEESSLIMVKSFIKK